MRVLIVEDRLVTQSTLGAFLEINGCWISHAENGKRAIDRLAVGPPDVIVTDYLMPEMDGLAFLKAMRKDDRYVAIPVAFVTGIATAQAFEVQDQLAGLQPVEFFHKPFDAQKLLDWLRLAVSKKSL